MQRKDSNHNTQRGEILSLLIKALGDRVPLPKILALSVQYNARLHELRKLGFRIDNERERVDGQVRSCYRLILDSQESPKSKSEAGDAPISQDNPQSETLFGDISRDRSYVE
jgi:hypothetical protein